MSTPEKTEKIKDIREWATFAVSIMTMLLIPGVGYGIALYARNQRLEAEKFTADTYLTQKAAVIETTRLNLEIVEGRTVTKEINQKLDTVIVGNNGLAHDLSAVRDQVIELKKSK